MKKWNYTVTNLHGRMQYANPMKLHIVWINKHADFTGGAERYIYDTVKELSKKGIKSTLLYQLDGQVHPRFTHAFNSAYPLIDLNKQLNDHAPNIIYIHQLDHLEQLEACIDSGIPSIRFYHDHKLFCLREHKYTTIGLTTCQRKTGPACYRCLGFIGRNNKHQLTVNRMGHLLAQQNSNRKLAGYIVASDYMSHVLAQHEFMINKTHVIPLFTTPNKAIIELTHSRKKDLLLYVGGLTRGKGVDILLRALACLNSQVQLMICGEGPQKKELQQLSHKLGLENRVDFKGHCDASTLTGYYQQASALVIPSRSPETFCLTGIEALSQACPVIATSVGAIPEWLQDGINGRLVESNNVSALSGAIRDLLQHPQTTQEHALLAQQRILQQYTINHHIQQLIQVFQQILREHSDPIATTSSMLEERRQPC